MQLKYTRRLVCHLTAFYLSLGLGGAYADPLTDTSKISGKLSKKTSSPAANHAPLPSVGNETLNKIEPEHEHSFSGFYAGVHGGFATGKDETGVR